MKVDDSGVARLQAKFTELVSDMRNPVPAIKFTALLTVQEVKKNFDREKNENGTVWPRLKNRPGGRPLIDRQGRMQKGITYELQPRGFLVGGAEVTKDYNAVHNFGSRMWLGSGHKKGVPQRQFMYLMKTSADFIVRQLKDFLKRRITSG